MSGKALQDSLPSTNEVNTRWNCFEQMKKETISFFLSIENPAQIVEEGFG